MDDILDSNIKPKKTKWSDLIPTVLVLFLFVWKISKYLINHYYFELESAIGFIVIAIATALYFVNKNYYIYTVLSVFIIGLFGFVNFTPAKHMFTIFFVSFDPFFLVLLACHLTIFYYAFEFRADQSRQEIAIKEVESFKTKFKDKTIPELEEIAHAKGMREEAKQAALELIKMKR